MSQESKKQTAVEWLIQQIKQPNFIHIPTSILIDQAKEMEKQQIMDAHISAGARLEDISIEAAEQYYAEVYGKQQNA
jgi:hypothetical protein